MLATAIQRPLVADETHLDAEVQIGCRKDPRLRGGHDGAGYVPTAYRPLTDPQ